MQSTGPLPDTHGLLRVLAGADPAAGAQAFITISPNVRWRIIAIQIILVADATVVTRNVHVRIQQSGQDFFRVYANLGQTAGQTIQYFFLAGGPDRSAAIQNTLNVQFPTDFWINDAFSLDIQANGLQAGDNFGAPLMMVEEWSEE